MIDYCLINLFHEHGEEAKEENIPPPSFHTFTSLQLGDNSAI